MRRMLRRYRWEMKIAGLMLLALIGSCCPSYGQQLDTLTIGRHLYEFYTSTESEESANGDRMVMKVSLLGENGRQLLQTFTIHESSLDCNSMELELGAAKFNDTVLIWHTLWDYTDQAMGGTRGSRIQVYHFMPDGSLQFREGDLAIYPSPQHFSIEGLSFYRTEMRDAGETNEERRDQELFIERNENQFGARMVFGHERLELERTVDNMLGSKMESALDDFGGIQR